MKLLILALAASLSACATTPQLDLCKYAQLRRTGYMTAIAGADAYVASGCPVSSEMLLGVKPQRLRFACWTTTARPLSLPSPAEGPSTYRLSTDLKHHQLAAGEPLILELQLLKSDGEATDIADTSLVLSVYRQASGDIVEQVIGDRRIDANGDELFRWTFDGSFSDGLRGQKGLRIELARRLNKGREVFGDGDLKITSSAKTVPPLDGAAIGEIAQRVTMRAASVVGQPATISVGMVLLSDLPLLVPTVANTLASSLIPASTVAGM